MPLQQTSGNSTTDAYGGGAAAAPNYIEDMFSTWLYTGTGAAQTITNNIDLSGKGGMVWTKSRNTSQNNNLFDTTRGATKYIQPNVSGAEGTDVNSLTAFNTTGFTLGTGNGSGSQVNTSAVAYASWTFREQAKFFDIVAYTGDGTTKAISHALGSTPGFMIIAPLNIGNTALVYHKNLDNNGGDPFFLQLDSTAPVSTSGGPFGTPTSTTFTVKDGFTNTSGTTYIAYLFASNASGFGIAGTDNVITCGTYTGNGSTTGPVVTLGYEPQWILIKRTDAAGAWWIQDNMRGLKQTAGNYLVPNSAAAEATSTIIAYTFLTATGFQLGTTNAAVNLSGGTYVYVAIRRGPMKVPTVGTSVFGTNARTGTGANATVTGGQTDDAVLVKNRGSAVGDLFAARFTGTGYLETSSTAAEVAAGTGTLQANPWDVMDGVKVGTTSTIINASGNTFINYLFKRAPSFFDVVCYTGDGTSNRSVNHNLGVTPELYIIKGRSGTTGVDSWAVYNGFSGVTKVLRLETTDAVATDNWFGTVAPSASYFSCNADYNYDTTSTYICYLFATCPGVSKVGTYTGNGSTQTINCGFTGGARFVLIKRTDSTGNWYIYDTARGMTTLTDPYFLANTTAAEVATLGSVTTSTTGFDVNATILAAINTNAATYIFLAIA